MFRRSAALPVRAARVAIDDLVTTMFPADCRVCGGPLLFLGNTPICDACVGALKPQAGLLCPVCGEATGMESSWFASQFRSADQVCTPCRRVPPQFERAVAYGVYEGEMREMLHLLKYEGLTSVADVLGGRLATAMVELAETNAVEETIVVTVPLFRDRLGRSSRRAFNQADLLAGAALRELKRRRPEWKLRMIPGAMGRVRETQSQFGLDPRGRRANVRGAFRVPGSAMVAGREVILVDDIFTTGATVRECSRVLRRAGATRVRVATLSRAQQETATVWDGGNVAIWNAPSGQADETDLVEQEHRGPGRTAGQVDAKRRR